MSVAATPTLRRDVKILGLVSAGHFISHFYSLCLPPLFLFIREDLGASFAMLGFLMSVRSFISGGMQIPAGFLTDKIGAKPVLIGGLAIMAGTTALMAFAPNYWVLLLLTIFIALGNSVFHPTDYAILNSSMSRSWIGRAFSVHTFAGHLGTALAPAVIVFIALRSDWRMAQLVVGIIGFVVLAALALQWRDMADDAIPKKRKKAEAVGAAAVPRTWRDEMAVLLTRPMIIMSLFFTMTSLHSGGMQSFFVVGLTALHDVPAETAGTALSSYLLASAVGVLMGGVLADFTKRHDLTAAAAFAVSAAILALVTWVPMNEFILVAIMVVSGLMQGAIRPARDMMVRAAVPKGAMGKAFGFVSSGASIGGSLAPVLFGYLIDIGRPDLVFYLLIFFTILCVFASVAPKEHRTVEVR
jgi:FSR family fosmidomycin resistance protein-like MFS transporter